MFRFLTLARILSVALSALPANVYSQDAHPVEVCDTPDNLVVDRNDSGNGIFIHKAGRFICKKQIISSYDFREEDNETAIRQCCAGCSKEKIEQLVSDSCAALPDEKAVGYVSLYLILSKTLNIEYFELRGHNLKNLSDEDALNIYRAIGRSDLFNTWDCKVPYVSLAVYFAIPQHHCIELMKTPLQQLE